MPIRDVELYFPAGRDTPRVLSNRGANGIDGTVSTAFGAAAAGEGPVVLLIGDVALAHDIGGLLAARRLGLAMTIVLLNNDGGGIFHFLPVAGERDAFEEHVATPHGLDFACAAALYGCEYQRPGTPPNCEPHSMRRSPPTAPRSSRCAPIASENLALHRRVAAAALVQCQITEIRVLGACDRLGARRDAPDREDPQLTERLSRTAPAASPASLTSVSASSAAGSESRTIPQPA